MSYLVCPDSEHKGEEGAYKGQGTKREMYAPTKRKGYLRICKNVCNKYRPEYGCGKLGKDSFQQS